MKAISLLQPWADAVLFLGKDYENRTWATKHRGPLCIHASAGWDRQGEVFINKWWNEIRVPKPFATSAMFNLKARERRGMLVGIVNVTECVDLQNVVSGSIWAFGPKCWHLENPAMIAPLKMKGKLGLWEWKGESQNGA